MVPGSGAVLMAVAVMNFANSFMLKAPLNLVYRQFKSTSDLRDKLPLALVKRRFR